MLVIAFPSDDYFGAVLTSAQTTLGLGLFALMLGFVLLYFSRRLIPTMERLKALVMIRTKEVNARLCSDSRRKGCSNSDLYGPVACIELGMLP